MRLTFLATVVAIPVLAASAFGEEPRVSYFPRGAETCFGRIYDAAHLKAHPQQKVTRFFLWNELTEDPLREYGDETSAEKRAADLDPDGRLRLQLFLHRRDRGGMEIQSFDCSASEGSELFCGVDCDGGYFTAKLDKGSLLVTNEGFQLEGVCEGGVGFLYPEPDDRTFRLDPQPPSACLAERDRGRPSLAKAGPPLSTRLYGELDACYERTYDAAHLAATKNQTVAAIWLRKTAGEFFIGARQRDGTAAEARAECGANTYNWSCYNPSLQEFETEGPDPRGNQLSPAANLARDGADILRLTNHRNNLAKLLGLKLGAGDDVFRLRLANASQCGVR